MSRPAELPLLAPQTVLSFDVEEHWRIEAAVGLQFTNEQKAYYAGRVGPAMHWILDELARYNRRATFFVVGELGREQPQLVRAMVAGGHEVASHSWDHQRVHNFTPAQFHEDVRRSKDALEQISGQPVVGYRAPTFSIVRQTGWAVDVLAELGIRYDSSVYPVRHDRYGIPDAPRGPFWAMGREQTILELPPARLDLLGFHLPAGGGGYFRLFPLHILERAVRQVHGLSPAPIAMLYFHPWEFDPRQERLPLGRVSRFRTYVGMSRARPRLATLIRQFACIRACDVVKQLESVADRLPQFKLLGESAA